MATKLTPVELLAIRINHVVFGEVLNTKLVADAADITPQRVYQINARLLSGSDFDANEHELRRRFVRDARLDTISDREWDAVAVAGQLRAAALRMKICEGILRKAEEIEARHAS